MAVAFDLRIKTQIYVISESMLLTMVLFITYNMSHTVNSKREGAR